MIQFSGLYRFQAKKSKFEVARETFYGKWEESVPNTIGTYHHVRDKIESTGSHDKGWRNGFFSPQVQGLKASMVDGAPGYRGALITGKDIQNFWQEQAPDVFTPDVFEKYEQLGEEELTTQKAYEDHLGTRIVHDDPDYGKKRRKVTNTTLGQVLTPLLFHQDVEENKKFVAKLTDLKTKANQAAGAFDRFNKALGKAAVRVQRSQSKDAFETAVFNFVERHPTDAEGDARQDIWVASRKDAREAPEK